MFKNLFKRKKPKPLVVATLNLRIMPIDRGEMIEEPLAEALKNAGMGEIVGGGTMLHENKEIDWVDIEIEVPGETPELERFLVGALEDLYAPKGSRLSFDEGNRVVEFGNLEGLRLFLPREDLLRGKEEGRDINVLVEAIIEATADVRELATPWEGDAGVAFYIYGDSYEAIRAIVEPMVAEHPDCGRRVIERIA